MAQLQKKKNTSNLFTPQDDASLFKTFIYKFGKTNNIVIMHVNGILLLILATVNS